MTDLVEYDTDACYCVCGHNHPGRSLCLGEVPARDVTRLRYSTRDVDRPVEVPMCSPCAEATVMAS